VIPITRPALPPLDDYVALLERIWDSRMLSNFATYAAGLETLATGTSARRTCSRCPAARGLDSRAAGTPAPAEDSRAGAVFHLQLDRERGSME